MTGYFETRLSPSPPMLCSASLSICASSAALMISDRLQTFPAASQSQRGQRNLNVSVSPAPVPRPLLMCPTFFSCISEIVGHNYDMSKTIVISDSKTNESKLRVPNCTVRGNGTIWHKNEMPICITSHEANGAELKEKYAAAIRAKQFGVIADEHYARLGIVGNMRVEYAEDYETRMAPIWAEEERKREKIEARQIKVYLSSRGWGDYSPVEWIGDREKPTAEIVAECQKRLTEGYDVDQPKQTDAEIAEKVDQAKQDSLSKQEAEKQNAAALAAIVVPESAVRAYKACRGNPENLPDDIDNPGYWLVRRYAAAIEHQGLAAQATMHKISEDLKEAAREEPCDY